MSLARRGTAAGERGLCRQRPRHGRLAVKGLPLFDAALPGPSVATTQGRGPTAIVEHPARRHRP